VLWPAASRSTLALLVRVLAPTRVCDRRLLDPLSLTPLNQPEHLDLCRCSSSPWSGKSRAGLIQLEHVLGSPRVGNACPVASLGSRRCSWPVQATGWSAVSASWPGDRVREETEVEGPL
jgi:hypothetical protein